MAFIIRIRYCTLFKVWGYQMLRQRVKQKIINGQSARVIVVPALLYSTLNCLSCVLLNCLKMAFQKSQNV